MVTEDVAEAPFQDGISPFKAMSLLDGLHYETGIRACNRKCPCRLWVNCGYYNKIRWKGSHDDERLTEITEWYKSNFRMKYETPDAFPNG